MAGMPSSYQPFLAGMPFSKIHPPYISERPPKKNCAQGLSAWHRQDVPPFITHLGRHALHGHAILSAPFHDGRPLNGLHSISFSGSTAQLIRSVHVVRLLFTASHSQSAGLGFQARRTSLTTFSTWCVWGNMSTGCTASTRYCGSSRARSRACVAGLQLT